ncbi:hypothetical protein NQ318_012084 [Aromia moschata]|uniref:VHS domain-containing protein n=1 Tax=Aromia moschata TaxID=1265417 RepID=A0AAV8XKR3_9CUCU|nr:hypothetical protein NQ318_012084 [Aromia moschata]
MMCSAIVHEELTAKPNCEFLHELAKTTPHENVRSKLLELIQAWSFALRKNPKHGALRIIYCPITTRRGRVRLVTLELALKLFVQLVMCDGKSILLDSHKQTIETARTQSTALLRNFYKSEEIFLDMFEHDYEALKSDVPRMAFSAETD